MEDRELLRMFEEESGTHPFSFLYSTINTVLQQMIFMEKYPPHSELKAGEVAKALHVSRTPVSRALDMLVQQGLLIPTDSSGYLVAQMDYKTLRDIMELRSTLEPPMANYAVRNATEENLADIAKMLQCFQGTDYRQLEYDQLVAVLSEQESQFLNKLCNMCSNPFVQRMYRETTAQIRYSIYFINRFACANLVKHSPELFNQCCTNVYYSLKNKHGRMAMDAIYSYIRRVDIRDINYGR